MRQRASNHTFAISVLSGLAGAGIALLVAPRSGRETRARIRSRTQDLKEEMGDKVSSARESLEQGLDQARDVKTRLRRGLTSKARKAKEAAEEENERLSSPTISSWE